MADRRKGKRLAVVLTPKWRRWWTVTLAVFNTVSLVGFFVAFFYSKEAEPSRIKLVLTVFGLPLLACIWAFVRELSLSAILRETRVEIDHEPVAPGESVRIFALQTRDASRIRSLEVGVVCRRTRGRGAVEDVLTLPLAIAPPADPDGRRAQVEGTLVLPADAPVTSRVESPAIEWSVHLRVDFDGRRVYKVDYPFEVAPKEKPPAS